MILKLIYEFVRLVLTGLVCQLQSRSPVYFAIPHVARKTFRQLDGGILTVDYYNCDHFFRTCLGGKPSSRLL